MRLLKKPLRRLGNLAGLLTVTLTVTLAAPGAQAQQADPFCDARTTLLMFLNGKYAEKTSAMGLANNGAVVEILNSENGTWTILVTTPNGVSCLLATGKHWQQVVAKAKGIPM